MKHVLLSIFIFLALLGGSFEAKAQCPDPAANNNGLEDFRTATPCAIDNQVWWKKTYTNVSIDESLYDVYFRFDWGDGDIDYIRGTGATLVSGTTYKDWEFISGNTVTPPGSVFADNEYAYHNYQPGEEVCTIDLNVTITVVPDGAPAPTTSNPPSDICNDTFIEKSIVYWDTDDRQTGNLDINEPDNNNDNIIRICQGQEIIIDPFTDGTRFNCVGAALTAKNSGERWFQWVYNTNNFGVDNNIENIELLDASNAVIATLNSSGYTGEFQDGIQHDPVPPINLVTNANQSFKLKIHDSTEVGDRFEITFRNWNPCNPFDDPKIPGSPSITDYNNRDFDPIESTVIVEIVDSPDPEPQVENNAGAWIGNGSNPNPAASFCVNERIDFQHPTYVAGDSYAWDFDWDGTEGGFNVDKSGRTTFTSYGTSYIPLSPIRVGLRISRGGIGTPCIFYEEIWVEILNGPVADFNFNGSDSVACEAITFSTNNISENASSYTWNIVQVEGTGGLINGLTAANRNDFNLTNIDITGPGAYEVSLLAESTTVNCPTTYKDTIFVYAKPVADFTANEICEGDITTFTDLSNLSTSINNDAIGTWEFVFNFNSTDFITDPEGTFDSQTITTLDATDFNGSGEYDHLYPGPGEYKVALRVRTDSGACVSSVDTATVIVKANPNASIGFDLAYGSLNGIDYLQPICPGVDIALLNTSTAGQTNPIVDEFYALIISQDNDTILFDPSALLGYWDPNTRRIVDVSDPLTKLENSTGALYNYDIYMIAVGDNGCETVSSPITITLLPEDDAGFEIYEENPGNPNPEIFDPGKFYCSPTELFFETDALTKSFNADEYNWLITDAGTGDTLVFQNVNPVTTINDERFSFNFGNSFPNVNQRIFNIELEVITSNFCIANRRRSVTIYPEPSSNFILTDVVAICDSVSYRFEAQQSSLQYNWSVDAPTDPSKITSTIQNNNFFLVNIARPSNTEADLDFEVSLFTRNLVNCFSNTTTFDSTVYKAEDITVAIDFIPNNATSCLPAEFDLRNTTDFSVIPAGTNLTWAFQIDKFDSVTMAYEPLETLNGFAFPLNKDFTNAIPYEFSQPGGYRVDLLATAESNCVFGLGTPVEIEIFETPEVQFVTDVSQGCAKLPVTLFENSSSQYGTPYNLTLSVLDPISGNTVQTETRTSTVGFDGFIIDSLENTGTTPIDYEIIMVASNAFGCSDSLTRIVKVFPRPQIDFDVISIDPACEDNYEYEFDITTNNVPAKTIYRWTFGTLGSVVDSFAVNQTKLFFNPNSYSDSAFYTVTVEAITPNGCSAIATKGITLLPQVRASFFKFSNQICSSDSIEFNSNSQGTLLEGNHIYEKRLKFGPGTWVNFANTPDASGAVFESFTNPSDSVQVYEIQYSVFSDAGGCIDTAAIQEITVFPEPTLPSIVGPTLVCQGEQNAKFYLDNHINGYKYQWIVPDDATFSAIQPNRDTILVDFGASPFNSSISVIVTDSSFCKGDTVKLPITVIPGSTGSLTLTGPGTICPGDSTTIQLNLSGPGSLGFDVVLYNGLVNDTLINVVDGQEVYVSPTQSGNYVLREIIDREYPSCPGNPSNDDVRINVSIAPTAAISGNALICEGETTELRINLTGQAPWSVIYSDGNDSTTVNSPNSVLVIPVSPTVTTSYTLVSVSDNNCTGTVSPDVITVNVNKAPVGSIFATNSNPEICVGNEVELGFSLAGYGPWSVNYTDGTNNYGFTDIQPRSGSDPDNLTDFTFFLFNEVPTDAVTTYTLTEVIDSRGCVYNTPSSITVNLLPVPQALMTTTGGLNSVSICEGESVPLNFNFPSGEAPFDLRIAVNDFDTVQLDDVANPDLFTIDTLAENTTFRIVSLVDNNGCTTTNLGLPVRVNVRERPTAVLSGTDSICYGEETNLTFNLTGKGPWQIFYTDGMGDTLEINTPFNRHFELVSPLVTTEYTLVSVTDSNSPKCSGPVSGTANVEVASELIASFTATPENMILPERTITITNTTTNKEEWDYLWQFGDSTTSTAVDPGTHVYETYGTYFVTMTATSKNGECSDNFQTIIEIDAIPAIVDFDATPRVGCLPLTVQFENLTQFADSTTYLWDFGDNQSTRVTNPEHTYTRPGTYRVRLSANNITGVPVEEIKEQFITVYETPEAIFNVRRGFEQVFTEERVEFSNSSNNADQFLWNFGDGNESNEFEPVHMYADSGIYDITLIAINSSTGCPDTLVKRSQVLVLTDGEFKVPNAFTPSRGGQGTGSDKAQDNDFFRPIVNGASQYNLKIFNRWGELLFESNDKDTGWDGYYKGELMPMGVYVFRLEIVYENGRREVKLGDVTLVR